MFSAKLINLVYLIALCFTFINASTNKAYDYFRILFDNQSVLKPHDIDLITNQLMENVNFF